MNRQTLLVTFGWISAAVLAVVVGLAAISVIGDGLTTPETRPLSAAEVADELARRQAEAASATPSASAATGDAPSPAETQPSATQPAAVSKSFRTGGGTVVGRCAGSRPEIVSMSPKQGYELHEQDRGPQGSEAEGEFRSLSDNHDRYKFDIVCRSGVPVLADHD